MSLDIPSTHSPSTHSPSTHSQAITYLLDAEEYVEIEDAFDPMSHPISEDVSAIGWDTSIGKTSLIPAITGYESAYESGYGSGYESVVSGSASLPYPQNESPESYLVKPQPGYIQGVVRGQKAYLITNLRNSASSCLYQPQMTWTIGRNRDAALPLRDRMLSRRHSVLMYVRTEGFYLVDLNSMNGSYVNGKRVENRIALQDGDFIRVGHTEFFFFLSTGYRKIEAIHPQVLNRLLNPEEKGNVHIDYAEIREEISFNLNRS